MISVFTDASVSSTQRAGSGCVVLRDNTFMGSNVFPNCPGTTSLYAEVWGAIQALNFARNVCDNFETDVIVLYTDAIGVLDSFKAPHTNNVEQLQLDREFQALVRKYNVHLELIKGHQYTINPNKVVDYLAGKATEK